MRAAHLRGVRQWLRHLTYDSLTLLGTGLCSSSRKVFQLLSLVRPLPLCSHLPIFQLQLPRQRQLLSPAHSAQLCRWGINPLAPHFPYGRAGKKPDWAILQITVRFLLPTSGVTHLQDSMLPACTPGKGQAKKKQWQACNTGRLEKGWDRTHLCVGGSAQSQCWKGIRKGVTNPTSPGSRLPKRACHG